MESGDFPKPLTFKRNRGGWLAVSPPDAALQIGACGRTEPEARARFAELVRKCVLARNEELGLTETSH